MKTLNVNEDDFVEFQRELAKLNIQLQQGTSAAISNLIKLMGATPPSHPDDMAVSRFAIAMKDKMRVSREKGRGGWDDEEAVSGDELADMLIGHLLKDNHGNFVDIANFCMMLQQRGDHPSVLANALQRRFTP